LCAARAGPPTEVAVPKSYSAATPAPCCRRTLAVVRTTKSPGLRAPQAGAVSPSEATSGPVRGFGQTIFQADLRRRRNNAEAAGLFHPTKTPRWQRAVAAHTTALAALGGQSGSLSRSNRQGFGGSVMTATRSPRRRGRLSLCVRASWQVHRKDRTFARLARDRHITAHQARELTGDGKAESRAPETLCSRGIGPGELLEQL